MRVGDFLLTDTPLGVSKFVEAMSIFQIGELMELDVDIPLVYLGINLSLYQDGSVGISQTDFISRLQELKMSDFGVSNKLLSDHADIRTRFRGILG